MKTTLMMLAALAALMPAAHAAPVAALEGFFEQDIAKVDDAVSTTPGPELGNEPDADEEAWYLRSFFLRIKPRAGFEIPGLVKIEIIPEAELLWQRPVPEGWSSYKPKAQ